MHKLTSNRMKWGQAALLTGAALGAMYVSGRPIHCSRPGMVSLMSVARRMPPDPVHGRRSLDLWPGLLSPDGKWELNWVFGGDSECTVVAHDHSRSVVRRLRSNRFWVSASNKIWSPDSQSWVGLLCGEKSLYAVVQSLDTAGAVRKISLGFPKGTVEWPDLMPSELLGFTRAGRVLAQAGGPDRPGQTRKVPFYEFSLGSAGGNLRQYEIALPKGVELGEVALSLRGDRLAWILYQGPRCQYGAMAATIIELAVSGTDGRAMRIIGRLPTEPGERYYQPRRLAWLPDGAHVSLSHAGVRWSVPVRA